MVHDGDGTSSRNFFTSEWSSVRTARCPAPADRMQVVKTSWMSAQVMLEPQIKVGSQLDVPDLPLTHYRGRHGH